MHPNSAPSLTRVAGALLAAFALSAANAAASPADSLFSSARELSAGGAYLAQVALDPGTLQSARTGQAVKLVLPGVGRFQVIHDGVISRNGGQQWMGHLKEGVQYSVVLLQTADGVTGDIRTPQGAFRLGHANGKQWLAREGVAGSVSASLAALPRMFELLPAAKRAAAGGQAAAGASPARAAFPVNFNLVAMSGLNPGDEISLDVPGRGSYRVAYEDSRANDSGSTTWVGYLKDYGNDFRVIITTGPDGSVGNILTPSGELELMVTGNNQWLVDRAGSGWSMIHPGHSADGIGQAGAPGIAAGGMAAGGATAGTPTVTVRTASGTVNATQIDVLVLYTPGFVTRLPSTWRTRIDQLVALSNQAYLDSNIAVQIRAAGVAQVNLSDQTTNSSALSALQAGSGAFANVPALRKQYGADLVTLVRPFYMNAQGQNCGVGYVGGYGGSNIAAYASYAYSVVSDGRDVAGTNYYCTDYTFAHELGHNMGSMHDRATVTAQGGGTGAYPYSFGYGKSGSFGTVMSYISPVVGKFSNPNVLTCGGSQACGVPSSNTASSADNAQSITNTATAVAGFLPTAGTTVTYTIAGVVSRNGTALAGVTFSVSGSGASCGASATNGSYSCTAPAGWSGTLTPVLSGNTFTPVSRNYSNLAASQANQNFAAAAGKLTISGSVIGTGSVAGVSFGITGSGVSCTTSSIGGTYTCTVPYGWSGKITPGLTKARFLPSSISYANLTASRSGQNYLKY